MEKAKLVNESDCESDATSNSYTSDLVVDGEKVSRAIRILAAAIDCLMDIIPTMEDTLSYTNALQCRQKASAYVEFQISGPGKIYASKVYDQYSKADTRLVERLGEANWQRHTLIRIEQSSVPDNLDNSISETGFGVTAPPKSLFIPASMFQDSGLGTSVPAQSNYAVTVASHSSFVSSLGDKEKGRLQVPATPKEVFDGIPFTCEICGHILHQIKNRIDWKYVAIMITCLPQCC